jgi:hypothetical protein
MIAQIEILGALPIEGSEPAALSHADLAMMEHSSFRESSRLPTHHPGRRDGQPVDAAALHGLVSSNGLEALAPEELAGARHMLDVGEPVVVGLS